MTESDRAERPIGKSRSRYGLYHGQHALDCSADYRPNTRTVAGKTSAPPRPVRKWVLADDLSWHAEGGRGRPSEVWHEPPSGFFHTSTVPTVRLSRDQPRPATAPGRHLNEGPANSGNASPNEVESDHNLESGMLALLRRRPDTKPDLSTATDIFVPSSPRSVGLAAPPKHPNRAGNTLRTIPRRRSRAQLRSAYNASSNMRNAANTGTLAHRLNHSRVLSLLATSSTGGQGLPLLPSAHATPDARPDPQQPSARPQRRPRSWGPMPTQWVLSLPTVGTAPRHLP